MRSKRILEFVKKLIRRILPSYRAAAGARDLILVHEREEAKRLDKVLACIDAMNTEIQAVKAFQAFSHAQSEIFNAISLNVEDCHSAVGVLKELQEINFYLLKNIKRVADEIGIQFWLHGGTLLGAQRHGGFIPWDDDIDIGILPGNSFS